MNKNLNSMCNDGYHSTGNGIIHNKNDAFFILLAAGYEVHNCH